MKRVIAIALLLTFTSSALLFQSCRKDFEFNKIRSLDWNPDLAIPLVNDSITFEQALIETDQEKNFYIDETGDVSILFYYNNKAFRLSPNELIKIPDYPFAYDRTFSAAEAGIIQNQDFPIPLLTFPVNLNPGSTDMEINKLRIKKGRIVARSVYSFSNPGYMELRILNATLGLNAFSTRFGPFTEGVHTDTIDLAGVNIDLSSSPNMLTVQITGLIKQGNEPAQNDRIQTEYTVEIDEIGRFEGYLGQQIFAPEEDFVKVTAFNNAYVLGDLYFSDPKVSITIYNSIGIPATVTIQKLWAHNDASNVTLDITDRLGTSTWFDVPSPLITNPVPVSKTMSYTNATTGNAMHELFNLKPDRVYFKVKTQINPEGKTLNFFNDTCSMYANLLVHLPLYGHFDHLTLQDTFDFVLNRQKEIESFMFRTKITNGLPLTARMQIYFTDSVFNKIDSLTGTEQILIAEAPVDPGTALPYPGQFGLKDTSFYFDKARMDGIAGATKIIVRSVMNTTDEGQMNVRIKAAQRLKLEFTALVRLRMSVNPGN